MAEKAFLCGVGGEMDLNILKKNYLMQVIFKRIFATKLTILGSAIKKCFLAT